MNKDINVEALRSNCFRQSKIPGEFMFQMRVPGGITDAKHLGLVQEIATKYGNGTFHFGTRQTFNVPGIKYENIEAVNALVKGYIEEIEVKRCNVDMETDNLGYPTLGARNIGACIGGEHCIKANISTAELSQKLEKIIYPSHYHIKINITGCPNDCIKAHMSDFGIYGVTLPQYDYSRCVECGGCERTCRAHSVGAITEENGKMIINRDLCIGCGECTDVCPTRAMKRYDKKLYRITIGGRTGRKNPRIGKVFVDYVTEETLLSIFENWIPFSKYVLHGQPVYMHGGHLMDMVGYEKVKEMLFKDVQFNEEAKIAKRINWSEVEYKTNINVVKASEVIK
ncbi:sulfite reductase subunit C [uncultured Clostridium sp.]|uniref:sulfite reductase subunit C n=1 Tax=uncultured Clostridium sp. TaxID=59620 RepID=UPI002631A1F7|nr:sulfite reductase subunit C [uncultured Clostridium sp.]